MEQALAASNCPQIADCRLQRWAPEVGADFLGRLQIADCEDVFESSATKCNKMEGRFQISECCNIVLRRLEKSAGTEHIVRADC